MAEHAVSKAALTPTPTVCKCGDCQLFTPIATNPTREPKWADNEGKLFEQCPNCKQLAVPLHGKEPAK